MPRLVNISLLAPQGAPVDIGGYYLPDPKRVARAMQPSKSLNAIIGETLA